MPSTGSLMVTANLDGASVHVNGTAVGSAPYEDADIRIGSHEVKVTKEGYADYVEIVRIRPGKSAELRVSLELLPPSMRIVSDVPGATVFLDRNYIGTTPVDIKAVEPGEHQLTVSADGYDMYTETVSVTTGHKDVRVSFEQAALELTESVSVIHKHSFGNCNGTLIADSAGIRYETDHKDAFATLYGSLERLEVDYIKKNMNLKVRKGKTITSPNRAATRTRSSCFKRTYKRFWRECNERNDIFCNRDRCFREPGSTATEDPLASNEGIPNYYRLRDDIATAGQPTDEALEDVKKAGFKAVLNLRTEQEGSLEEKPKVEALGMEYYNIPIGRDGFSPAILEQFQEILADADNRPLLIHCASSNRVGALWYIHQVLDTGEDEAAALAEGKKAGLTSESLEGRAKDYVKTNKSQ